MNDLTPEMQAELRRLLDCSSKLPWECYRPHFASGYHSITASDGQTVAVEAGEYDAELIAAAINALPALLDAAAERDRLAEAVERVRALHGPRVVQVLGATCSAEECDHEDACPLVDYAVCGHCYDVGDGAHPYAYEDGGLQDVAHPCATYRALDESEANK